MIHRLDPRVRNLVAFLFSVTVALSYRLQAILVALAFSLLLVAFARLSPLRVFKRLLIVNGLILVIWLFVPFTYEGIQIFKIGPLSVTKEGIIYAAILTVKSNSIILAVMALMATMPIFTMGRAMRRLGVPAQVREVRGIPLWLLREYLVEGGGTAESDAVVTGPGWRVHLEQLEDFRIGSLSVGQVRLELDGDEEGLARLLEVLEPKLLRAGG